MHTKEEKMEAFGRFLDIMDELRVKCPWDRKQTNDSLRPNTIEETYELCDALIRGDKKDICKELGDVLLHVGFYAKIGSETGDFDIKDVCDRLCEKLIYRHPHIYGNASAKDANEVIQNWELKTGELLTKTEVQAVMDGKHFVFNEPILEKIIERYTRSVENEYKRQEAVIDYDIDEYDERFLRHLALGYTKEMIDHPYSSC